MTATLAGLIAIGVALLPLASIVLDLVDDAQETREMARLLVEYPPARDDLTDDLPALPKRVAVTDPDDDVQIGRPPVDLLERVLSGLKAMPTGCSGCDGSGTIPVPEGYVRCEVCKTHPAPPWPWRVFPLPSYLRTVPASRPGPITDTFHAIVDTHLTDLKVATA